MQKKNNSLFNLIYKLWWSTLRVERETLPSKFILAVWHQDLFLAFGLFKNLNMGILLSQSEDAENITSLLDSLNYSLYRGSSSNRFQAVRHLIKHSTHHSIGMALDGPKGPPLVKKAGVDWLINKVPLPCIHLNIEYKYFIRLSTWDKMILPLPFSKVIVKWGDNSTDLSN